jgi:hypothetical protein
MIVTDRNDNNYKKKVDQTVIRLPAFFLWIDLLGKTPDSLYTSFIAVIRSCVR